MPRTAGVAMARFVGIDDLAARRALRNEFGIEVGGGLVPCAVMACRLGRMGHSARERSVVTLRGALRLDRRGRPFLGGFICIRAARRNRLLPRIPGRRRSCLPVGVDYDSDLALAKKVLT